MKLAYLETGNRRFVGVRRSDHYVDLSRSSMQWTGSLTQLLELGPEGLAAAKRAADNAKAVSAVDPASVSYLRLNEPQTITCVGRNYAEHIRERGRAFPTEPSCFLKSLSSLVAHRQPIALPANSIELDYEVELTVVIGREGQYVPVERALDYIAGYTIMNDGSVRDFQDRYNNITLGKNFPASGALGPELVTADELPAGADGLRLQTKINDELVQDSTTTDLVFDVAMIVSLVSHTVGLSPGDVIATGTPSGVGAGHRPPRWLKAGDRIEMQIENIGILNNHVISPPAVQGASAYNRGDYKPKVDK